jgi:hypothetical protein
MGTVYGANATKALTPSGSDIIDQASGNAKLCVTYDSYEASALASASTIMMGSKLPVGARVIDVAIMADDMGSTVTCDVGDVADPDRYLDGVPVTTATESWSLLSDTANLGEINGFGYVITGDDDDQIMITTAGIWTGTIKMAVFYAI